LATTDDARVHCAVLKVRAVPVTRRHRASGRPVLLRMAAVRPFPQDPTACSACATPGPASRTPQAGPY